jgi:Spy/CpxP family protein refolding chaperone
MKIRVLSTVLALGVAGFAFAADTPDAPKGDAPKEAKPEAVAPKKAKGDAAPAKTKVEGLIGKVDLTDAQREEISKLRADLKAELKKINEEIAALKEAVSAKELSLLTPEQKKQLAELEEATKKAAAEKKAAKEGAAKEGAVKEGAEKTGDGDAPRKIKSETENPVKLP